MGELLRSFVRSSLFSLNVTILLSFDAFGGLADGVTGPSERVETFESELGIRPLLPGALGGTILVTIDRRAQ